MDKRSRSVQDTVKLLRPWMPLVSGVLHLAAVIIESVMNH